MPKKKIIEKQDGKFRDFLRLPLFFYHIIGFNPYAEQGESTGFSIWFYIYFLIHMGILNFMLGCEVVFVYFALKSGRLIEAFRTMGYIGFVFVADLKIIAVYWRRSNLSHLVHQMESIYPKNWQHKEYSVGRYLRQCRVITQAFSALYIFLISTYDMVAFVQYGYERWIQHLPNAKQTLPFVSTAPWNWHDNWKYYASYLIQTCAACTSSVGHISADLMIFALVIQILMHFDYVSKNLKEFQVSTQSHKDMIKLRHLIIYHNKILGLTEVLNEVFGWPLLLNVLASSMVVCLVGFQMTNALSPEQALKLGLFLVSATVEIYLICYLSQLLIEASGGVAFAVYDMHWFSTDIRFRKMLILMAMRAQKTACLRATVFLDISMETMSMFLKMSYNFFCLLRTMFQ